jgi:hypothetical protein
MHRLKAIQRKAKPGLGAAGAVSGASDAAERVEEVPA